MFNNLSKIISCLAVGTVALSSVIFSDVKAASLKDNEVVAGAGAAKISRVMRGMDAEGVTEFTAVVNGLDTKIKNMSEEEKKDLEFMAYKADLIKKRIERGEKVTREEIRRIGETLKEAEKRDAKEGRYSTMGDEKYLGMVTDSDGKRYSTRIAE